MYSREEIEKVRTAVDIVEVVREYVPSLNVTGRSAKGLCPFHGEKTPSFQLQPEKYSAPERVHRGRARVDNSSDDQNGSKTFTSSSIIT